MLGLVLLLALQAPVGSQAPGLAVTNEEIPLADRELPSVLVEVPLLSRLSQPVRWGRVRFRENLIRFSSYSAQRAKSALDGILIEPSRRAAALMALGCSGASGVRVILESWAVGGGPLEQRAAILALGELGGQDSTFLFQLADSENVEIAESALVALLRLDSPAVRDQVDQICAEETRLNSQLACEVLAFHERPTELPAPRSVKLLLELRWDAAVSYGLVGGKSRSQLRIEELERNPDFLEAVVLRSVATLSVPGVDDHLLAMVEDGGIEAIRVATTKIPETLNERFTAGTWRPKNGFEWLAVLDAIDEGGARPEAADLARGALELPAFRLKAAGLLVGMGDESAALILKDALYGSDPEARIEVCRAFGRASDSSWANELGKLRRGEPNPRIATAALVAQMRMGYQPADQQIRHTIEEGLQEERERVVEELLEVSRDSRVPVLLETAYPHLLGRLRLRVAADLVSRGRLLPRTDLLAALESNAEPDLADSFVRALRLSPSTRELQALSSLFPTSGVEVNIELALILIENNHTTGIGLLARALWNPPLDLSALAGALIVRERGIMALHEQLASPPSPVSKGGIRRVGFALGEWGGVEALEELARRRSSHDPALQGAYLGAMSVRTQ